jgi:RND family efflux transporter MFP subunit
MSTSIRRLIQIVMALVFIVVGFFAMKEMKANKPELKRLAPVSSDPIVKVVEIQLKPHTILIRGEGTVKPLREISLVMQVGGKVIYASPSLLDGGQFEKGDVLLRIEPADYKLAVTLAKAKVKDSESKLVLAREEAAAAREEWRLLRKGSKEEPPPLVAKEPQLAAAKARLEADRADLKKAQLNLERTEFKTPFAGRVSQENVDVGQYVMAGQVLASLYSTEAAEIMVPLADEDLAWLNVPGFTTDDGSGAKAVVKARFGGHELTWPGEVVRAEGKLDERTRMVKVVVRVADPYAKKPPLAVGLFVIVEIQGKQLKNAALIPRSLLHQDNVVWVVDGQNRLRFKKVEVTRFQGDKVLIESGLNGGEKVVESPLKVVTDGMSVKLAGSIPITGEAPKSGVGPSFGHPAGIGSPESIIAQIAVRLNLTPDQEVKVRPILLKQMKEQRNIVIKYLGKGPLSMGTMVSKMEALDESTTKKLGPILTEEQMKAYLVFQQEMRARRQQGPPMRMPPS